MPITEHEEPIIILRLNTDVTRTHLDSLPSNLRALVNRTVRAGMLRPMANVSVANKALIKPSANKISIVSFKIGSNPVTAKTNIIRYRSYSDLDLGFSQKWLWRLWSYRLQHCVAQRKPSYKMLQCRTPYTSNTALNFMLNFVYYNCISPWHGNGYIDGNHYRHVTDDPAIQLLNPSRSPLRLSQTSVELIFQSNFRLNPTTP